MRNCQEDKDSLGSWKYLKLDDNRSFVEQEYLDSERGIRPNRPDKLREHLQLRITRRGIGRNLEPALLKMEI
jgi:hypothetical protein